MNNLSINVETPNAGQLFPAQELWERLTEAQMNYVTMACRFGMSDQEIAEAAQTDVSTVKGHLFRAKERLGILNKSPRFIVASYFVTGPGSKQEAA